MAPNIGLDKPKNIGTMGIAWHIRRGTTVSEKKLSSMLYSQEAPASRVKNCQV